MAWLCFLEDLDEWMRGIDVERLETVAYFAMMDASTAASQRHEVWIVVLGVTQDNSSC